MTSGAVVGHRVDIAGHVGTVRYQGELAGQTGEWLGIEWDDVSRGKHNGELNGQVYFSCRSSLPPGPPAHVDLTLGVPLC